MPLLKRIKRTMLKLIVIAVVTGGFLSLATEVPEAHAGAEQGRGILEMLFSADERDLSFTRFEGELAELTTDGYAEALTRTTDFRDFVLTVVNFALGFLGLFAVLIVIYGGVLYVAAGGEEEKTQKGKKAITYAVIGLLIVLGSFAFVNTIIRGAVGETEERRFIAGTTTAASFNAMAEEVSSRAREIYDKYIFLLEVNEELENIKSEAGRPSLEYFEVGENSVNQVQRSDVLTFLHATKQRLLRIRARFDVTDEAYLKINEKIREIDTDIELIRRIPEVRIALDRENGEWGLRKRNEDEIYTCSDWSQIVDDFVNCIRYPAGLYQVWGNGIREKYTEERLRNELIPTVKKDLERLIDDNLERIERINADLAILDIPEQAEIVSAYNSTNSGFNEFKGKLDSDTPEIDVTELSLSLRSALEAQLRFAEALRLLQPVQARLRANVVSGNAPLTVMFDVGGTMDPAGGTILARNIGWDLAGVRRFDVGEDDDSLPGEWKSWLEEEAVDCWGADTWTTPLTGEDAEFYGQTFRECTYRYPGIYVASVKISSNDPTRYIPGTSTLVINVDPPIILLDLKVKADEKETQVTEYDERGFLLEDRNLITVSKEEARRGLTFDASKTPNFEFCEWDFGDGRSKVTGDGGCIQENIEYGREGRYTVTLTAVNRLGERTEKRFVVDVRELAARISIAPDRNVFIGDSVRLDGRDSGGEAIQVYEWVVDKVVEAGYEKVDLGANRNAPTFSHRFEEVGRYRIELTVTNPTDSHTTSTYLNVSSRPPIAEFDYEVKDSTQPSTVHFDALRSFNPDGDQEELLYDWTIRPGDDGGERWFFTEGTTNEDMEPVVKFREEGDYEVTLRVTDGQTVGIEGFRPEFGEIKKTITIDNVLDVAWDESYPITAQLDEEGRAEMSFFMISENAEEYEIDFGDGNSESGLMGELITHTYTTAGRFEVEATVYDEDYNENTIRKRVYIGASDRPLAHIGLMVNNVEIYDFSRPVTVGTIDNLRFDASFSMNTDGTDRNMNYSWDFGDLNRSSRRVANHSYSALSPPEEGFYTVTLRVIDQDDPTKYDEDEVYINVINLPPRFSNVQGVPEFRLVGPLRTPVDVRVRAFGAEDPDGEITQYRWWYFDVNDPERQMGMRITTSPTATLTIGTKGREGEEVTYGFGLEVMDNDNLTYSNEEEIMMGNYHTITVVNGPNRPPTASFEVDRTSVYVGDPVNFVSTSTDPDGEIVEYYWDFDGDGFHNVEATQESSISHTYTMRNMEGYNVRLKVVDDAGAEAVSDPIPIFVDSHAEPPRASFEVAPAEVIEDERGFRVQFTDTTEPDEEAGAEIIAYRWDFDIDYDSTGDGILDNDINSREANPVWAFPGQGSYRVRLTVTDNQGNMSEATQTVRVPLAAPPTADFTYNIVNGEVRFRSTSTADVPAGAAIVRYIWDFDVDNPMTEDSELENPIHIYTESGVYRVQLTVRDSHGSEDSIMKEVEYALPAEPIVDDPLPPPPVARDLITPDRPVVDPPTVRAVLVTDPQPAADGIIYLDGDKGTVKFDFSQSTGPISLYTFDKNIYHDSTGDGIPDNDTDFQTILPGRWTTNFEREWGRIGVKLTVQDAQGNRHSTVQEIIFN